MPFSVYSVLLLVASATIAAADPAYCAIDRYGQLTMFNGETAEIQLPCKYQLADLTCGKYHLKVTAGSAPDRDDPTRFSPRTAWIKVTDLDTKEYFKARTSLRRLKKAGNGASAWMSKEGDLTLSTVDYVSSISGAVLSDDDVFSIVFRPGTMELSVECNSEVRESTPVPTSLCGAMDATNAIDSAKISVYGPEGANLTNNQAIYGFILNDTTVTQGKTCAELTEKYRSCGDKERALQCELVTGNQKVASCLATSDIPLHSFYADCLDYACSGSILHLGDMLQHVINNCDTSTMVCGRELPGRCIPDSWNCSLPSLGRCEAGQSCCALRGGDCAESGNQLCSETGTCESRFKGRVLSHLTCRRSSKPSECCSVDTLNKPPCPVEGGEYMCGVFSLECKTRNSTAYTPIYSCGDGPEHCCLL